MWTLPWTRRRRRHPDPPPGLPPEAAAPWRDWKAWRPTSPRARTVIVVMAIVTALGVLWAMLQPQLALLRAKARAPVAAPADVLAPGGKLDVFVVPAPASASAPAR